MSQVGVFSDNAPGTIDIVSITPDVGTNPVVPTAGGNVTIVGGAVSSFTDSGIRTDGGLNTLTIELTNRVSGQVTTNNATPTTIITFSLGSTPAVYSFTGFTTGRSTATGDGACYFFDSCFRTNGTTATEIGTEVPTFFEDTSLLTADTTITASGNNVLVQVTGIAGTVNWDGVLTFRRVL